MNKQLNIELVRELYDKTGYGMLDCRKALQETDSDIDKAEEWLKKWKSNLLFTLDTPRH